MDNLVLLVGVGVGLVALAMSQGVTLDDLTADVAALAVPEEGRVPVAQSPVTIGTPSAPALGVRPPSVSPVGGESIDVNSLAIFNSPDVRDWPATATITRLVFGDAGLHVEFTQQDRWPDVVNPGWDGPIEYTVWLIENIGGQWCAAGIIEMWRGRDTTDSVPLYGTTQIADNWCYDSRWGPMARYQPSSGELIGIMVTAGDARGRDTSLVQERSNIATFPFPAGPMEIAG